MLYRFHVKFLLNIICKYKKYKYKNIILCMLMLPYINYMYVTLSTLRLKYKIYYFNQKIHLTSYLCYLILHPIKKKFNLIILLKLKVPHV